MADTNAVMAVGALCFGVVVSYITYRTLIRTTGNTHISDLTTVIGAIGGGAVTALVGPKHGDEFGWYAIGLAGGLAVYALLYLAMNGRQKFALVMAGKTIAGPGADPAPQGEGADQVQLGPRP